MVQVCSFSCNVFSYFKIVFLGNAARGLHAWVSADRKNLRITVCSKLKVLRTQGGAGLYMGISLSNFEALGGSGLVCGDRPAYVWRFLCVEGLCMEINQSRF